MAYICLDIWQCTAKPNKQIQEESEQLNNMAYRTSRPSQHHWRAKLMLIMQFFDIPLEKTNNCLVHIWQIIDLTTYLIYLEQGLEQMIVLPLSRIYLQLIELHRLLVNIVIEHFIGSIFQDTYRQPMFFPFHFLAHVMPLHWELWMARSTRIRASGSPHPSWLQTTAQAPLH